MLRRLGLLAAVAVLGLGLLAIAGCGGDDEKKSATPTATTTASGSGGEIGTPNEERVKAAVGACKQSIASQPQLTSRFTSKLEGICDDGSGVDLEAARKASEVVCRKIIKKLVPEGSARDQALTACDQAAEAP